MHAAVAFWGCERSGQLDLWNCARTLEYWRQHSPRSYGVTTDGCCDGDVQSWLPEPSPTASYTLGPYIDPITDGAWWYSPERPESAKFLGLQVLSVVGIDENETDRTTLQTGSCNGSLLHGPLIDDGYTIVVEGVLRGLSCCAVKYGLEVLRQQLRGCGCGGDCQGTQLRMLTCLPADESGDDTCGTYIPPVESGDPWRTYTQVVLKEQPVVTSKGGISCGSCGCGTKTTVRFTLRAAPGQFLDPVVLLGPVSIADVDSCEVNQELLCDVACEDVNILQDPNCLTPLLPDPSPLLAACYCPPFFFQRQCYVVSLGDRPFPIELEADIFTGSGVLRNLRISVWRLFPGMPDSYYTECNMCAGFGISYAPAASLWSRSACGGVTVRQFGRTVNGSATLLTPSGAPGSPCIRLPCGDLRICIDTDDLADDATITLFGREVEP